MVAGVTEMTGAVVVAAVDPTSPTRWASRASSAVWPTDLPVVAVRTNAAISTRTRELGREE
jgi:hypothetical protein